MKAKIEIMKRENAEKTKRRREKDWSRINQLSEIEVINNVPVYRRGHSGFAEIKQMATSSACTLRPLRLIDFISENTQWPCDGSERFASFLSPFRLFAISPFRLFSILLFAFFLLPAVSARAQTVDQILTVVNQDIITRSDLLWSMALDPKSPNPAENVSSDLLRQKLDVMIDQRVIEQEARRVPGAAITAEEISKKRTELIGKFKSEPEFRQRVEAVGLTPQKIDELVREMIYIERFVDFRFRSFVFVTEQEIKTYYDERLAPEIRKGGMVPPALDAKMENTGLTVRESINQILKQEKINQEIDTWLNATRQRADIVQLAEP